METLHILYKVSKNYPNVPALGIIGMEFAEGYQTLNSYIDGNVTAKNDRYTHEKCETDCKCMSDIIVNIIRLFISSGIIHLDLHSGNIMINKKSQKSVLIDFGKTKSLNVTQNDTEYELYKHLVQDKTKKVPTEDVLSNYLYANLGSACNHIGKGEQLFMQDYLSGIVDDDEGCKKLLKLFLLIVISERQLQKMKTGQATIQMSDFLEILGLVVKLYDSNLEPDIKKMFFDIHMLNDKNVTLDNWINNNIKQEFKLFFKNVILQTYETFKDYYRIDDSDKYNNTASKYTYTLKGGSSTKARNTKRPTKRKQSRKNRRKLSNKNVGDRKMK
jgi:serine/threonine protein kinase